MMPNNDFVSRHWLIDEYHRRHEGPPGGALKMIEEAPAADVVPVVRCKDCKYKPTAPDGITYGLQVEFPDKWANRCPCLCEDGWYSWVPDDDFFCAYGAKREEEDGTV